MADEKGLETIQYAIVVGLAAGAAIFSIGAIGVWISYELNRMLI